MILHAEIISSFVIVNGGQILIAFGSNKNQSVNNFSWRSRWINLGPSTPSPRWQAKSKPFPETFFILGCTSKDLNSIAEGFVLDERKVIVDEISYILNQPKSEVGVKIHSGRNRIVPIPSYIKPFLKK